MAVHDAIAVQVLERIDNRIEYLFSPACLECSALNRLCKIRGRTFADDIHQAHLIDNASARGKHLRQMRMGQRHGEIPLRNVCVRLGDIR